MTAAPGFPIASVLPGGAKAHSPSGASRTSTTTSTTQAPAGTAILSFRTGFERLIGTQQETSAAAASSEAVEGQLAEASATEVKSGAVPAFFSQIASGFETESGSESRSGPGQTPLAQTSQASSSSGRTQNKTLSLAQAAESQKPGPAALNAEAAAQSTVSSAQAKTAVNERAAHSRHSAAGQHSTKTAAQASAGMNAAFVQAAPIPGPAAALQPAQASQAAEMTARAATQSSSAGSAASAFTHPVSGRQQASTGTFSGTQSGSAATRTGLEEKALSTAASIGEETDSASDASRGIGIPASEIHAAHSAAASAQAQAQAALSSPGIPIHAASAQASAGAFTLDTSLKPSPAPPASGNAADPSHLSAASLQNAAASASPVRSGLASREHGPLQHEPAASATEQQVLSSAGLPSHTAPVRDASGLTGVSAERSNAAAHLDSGSSQPARDPFPLLDADPGQPATRWTHASARQVEAGYQDPALGWVSVRADATPGGLHASVLPSSPEAAQALGAHLSGLNSFLADQHGGSVTASLASPDGSSSAAGQNGHAGAGQQNSSGEPSTAQQASASSSSSSSSFLAGNVQGNPSPVPASTHNGHISVIA